MSDALAEIEAAIREAAVAHRSVKAKSTKQVCAAQEIDRLKSVAYAWFNTHRPLVAEHPSRPDLKTVDGAYRMILEATGRHAARNTYADALLKARRELVMIRSSVATLPACAPLAAGFVPGTDAPPNFSPLAADPGMQRILSRRWIEVQQCLGAGAYLAATVMMGGLLESLLLARINASSKQSAIFTASGAPRDKNRKTLPLGDWKLISMIEVAHEVGWITKSAREVGQVLRDFRNYIHPHKEYTDGLAISEDDAGMFWEVTKAVSRQVLGSLARSP